MTTFDEEEELRRLLEQQAAEADQAAGASPTPGAPASPGTAPGQPTVQQPLTATNPMGVTMAAPPPPPPPPPTFDDLNAALPGFALGGMKEPNRFLSPLAQATRQAGEQRLQAYEQDATAGIEEFVSGRGLVGSSVEKDAVVDLKGQMRMARGEEEQRLLEQLANYEAMDRAAAGQTGLSVGRFGFEQGLSGEQLKLERERLEQTERLHGSELGQRESEFARSLGMDEKVFLAEQDKFAKQFGEQVATRLQQDAQFGTALAAEDARFAVESGLRTRALDLQETGMSMDEAYRRAAMEQERELTEAAQRLQELGITTEAAYRYAALEQDRRFTEGWTDEDGTYHPGTLALQERGMSLDEAYRRAEMDMAQAQFNREMTRLEKQDLTEEARFKLMMDAYERYMALQEARDARAAGETTTTT